MGRKRTCDNTLVLCGGERFRGIDVHDTIPLRLIDKFGVEQARVSPL